MLAALGIALDEKEVARFCRERDILRLALFGSIVNGDFTTASDIDVLVEYMPGRHPGLMLFRHQDELAAKFQRPVDLHTRASLSPFFREEVIVNSLTIYEQT
jgi:predicted nucleotidyltransferase